MEIADAKVNAEKTVVVENKLHKHLQHGDEAYARRAAHISEADMHS